MASSPEGSNLINQSDKIGISEYRPACSPRKSFDFNANGHTGSRLDQNAEGDSLFTALACRIAPSGRNQPQNRVPSAGRATKPQSAPIFQPHLHHLLITLYKNLSRFKAYFWPYLYNGRPGLLPPGYGCGCLCDITVRGPAILLPLEETRTRYTGI